MNSVQEVYEAMADAGAGRRGGYSHVGFFSRGEGRFLPLEGAHPVVGEVGSLETVEEARLQMMCPPALLEAVMAAARKAHPYEEPVIDVYENKAVTESRSLGRVGDLEKALEPAGLAALVKERLGAAGVRYIAGRAPVATVAVCGGSGADLLQEARAAGAQALVTGESKHNLWLEAGELGLTLIDAGHFATENPVMEPLRFKLSELLPAAFISVSQSCTDGVRYL